MTNLDFLRWQGQFNQVWYFFGFSMNRIWPRSFSSCRACQTIFRIPRLTRSRPIPVSSANFWQSKLSDVNKASSSSLSVRKGFRLKMFLMLAVNDFRFRSGLWASSIKLGCGSSNPRRCLTMENKFSGISGKISFGLSFMMDSVLVVILRLCSFQDSTSFRNKLSQFMIQLVK